MDLAKNIAVTSEPATEEKVVIYTLADPRTGVVRYVGQTISPRIRRYQHLNDTARSHKVHWVNSLLAQGLQPVFEVLETVPYSQMREAECFWIEVLRFYGCPLTNGTLGGDGDRKSAETRRKMSEAGKRYKKTPEHIENMRKGMLGHVRTEESRLRQSESLKRIGMTPARRASLELGWKACRTPEVIAKNAEARRGGKRTPEQRARMSAAAKLRENKPGAREARSSRMLAFYEAHPEHKEQARLKSLGHVPSMETRRKLSLASKGRTHSPETIALRRASCIRTWAMKKAQVAQ